MTGNLETSLDRLYEVRPEEFVAARTALVKELRTRGDKDAAAAAAARRRPSPVAWALNQVARQQPALVRAALDAGTALRAATERALSGDRGAMRDAQAAQRQATDAVADAVVERLRAAGMKAADLARQHIATTMLAAVSDDHLADDLRAGRLQEVTTAAGFGFDGLSVPPRADDAGAAGDATGRATERARERVRADASARVATLNARVDTLEAEAVQAETAARAARAAVVDARAQLADAQQRLEQLGMDHAGRHGQTHR